MAFLGLPFASLILGVPLGVNLAYLSAASKTDASGTSQIVASGIRLELGQALKAEYAAFAEADKAVIAKALEEEMDTWKAERPKEEDPTLGSRALGALGTVIAAPITLPVAAVSLGVRGARAAAASAAEALAKPRSSFFNYFRKNAREDANAAPPAPDGEDGEDNSNISAASTVDTITKEDAINQFEDILKKAGGKEGDTKRLLYVIKNHPSIVTQPFGGKSALQLVVAAAIADAEGTPLDPGFFGRLAAAAAPAVSAIGRAGQIAAAAAATANETLNPVAIAKRRAREAEVLNDIYEPAPEDEVDDENETMTGGATMNEWAAVVTQILRTPYIYEDASLEDAVTALNERIKKEAKYKTARKKELAAQARAPSVVLLKKKQDAEFKLRTALDVLTAADDDAAKEDARLTVEVARARLSDANTALLEAKEDTETFNATAERENKEAAAEDAVGAREALLAAKELASTSRKATPRPVAAFNDLIAMRSVKPENRKRTATSLVPVLKAFMWWRWNVIHYPLSYTTEQVVDAQHLLDGMTARTQPIAPFFNASVTLRRNINEKRGLKPTPEEVAAAAAEKAAVALADKVAVEVAAQEAERKAAEAERLQKEEEQELAEAAKEEAEEEAARQRLAEAAAAKAAEDGQLNGLRGTEADLAVQEFGVKTPNAFASVLPPESKITIAPPVPLSNAAAVIRSSEPHGNRGLATMFRAAKVPPPPPAVLPLAAPPPPPPPPPAAASNEKIVTPEQLATRKAVRERKKQIDRVTYNTVPDDERSKKEHQGRLNLLITALAGEKDNVRRADEAANAAPAAEADAAAQAAADLEAAAWEAARVAEARAAAAAVDAKAAARAARMRGVTFVDQQVARAAGGGGTRRRTPHKKGGKRRRVRNSTFRRHRKH